MVEITKYGNNEERRNQDFREIAFEHQCKIISKFRKIFIQNTSKSLRNYCTNFVQKLRFTALEPISCVFKISKFADNHLYFINCIDRKHDLSFLWILILMFQFIQPPPSKNFKGFLEFFAHYFFLRNNVSFSAINKLCSCHCVKTTNIANTGM